MSINQKNVVVVGGGTGTSVVLSGLKKHPVNLTAVVSVADSGGSTGRLRDEFGFLPVGDLRQSLASLAESEDQAWIQKLLLYRFDHGNGLAGHNLGNLILTALQDMTGSTPESIEIAERIFNLEGSIYPVTSQNVQLVIEYEDGTFVIGEHHLNPESRVSKKIKHIRLSPKAKLYSKAKRALLEADLIIIGPGDVYASIAPNLIVEGMRATLKQTKAKLVYVVNLMNTVHQTPNFTASDHVREIEKYAGRKMDYIIVNDGAIPKWAKKQYEIEGEFQVRNDLDSTEHKIIDADLVAVTQFANQPQDALKRSILRHDSGKLTNIILAILAKDGQA